MEGTKTGMKTPESKIKNKPPSAPRKKKRNSLDSVFEISTVTFSPFGKNNTNQET
jgi:hypothetical protein